MTDAAMPRTKEEFMAGMEAEWAALMELVERLTPEQMLTPDEGGWSPKDNLAHLAEWMKILMGHHMDRRPAHEVMQVAPEVVESWDMEQINPVLFQRNRTRSTEDVLDELKEVYGRLHARLEAMSFEDLMKPRHEEDPERSPLLLWVLGDTTDHFAEHRAVIEKTM